MEEALIRSNDPRINVEIRDGVAYLSLGALHIGDLYDARELLTKKDVVSVGNGGTGADNSDKARENLGLGNMSQQSEQAVDISGGKIRGIESLAVSDGGTAARDAQHARMNLGLGSMASQDASDVDIRGGSITGVILPIEAGGTGCSAKQEAFDALSPLLQKGDMIVRGSRGCVVLPIGKEGSILTADPDGELGVRWISPTREVVLGIDPAHLQVSMGEGRGYFDVPLSLDEATLIQVEANLYKSGQGNPTLVRLLDGEDRIADVSIPHPSLRQAVKVSREVKVGDRLRIDVVESPEDEAPCGLSLTLTFTL